MKTKDPKYSVFKSIRFMLSMAWKNSKSVIFMCFTLSAIRIGQNMAQLYIAPQILGKVESAAPLGELFATIAIFCGLIFLLTTLHNYLDTRSLIPRVDVRSAIIERINHKSFTTSYSNFLLEERRKLLGRALNETDSNNESTEHIWTSLTSLLTNIGCFVLYLLAMSGVDPFLIIISLVSCLAASAVRLRVLRKFSNEIEQGQHWRRLNYLRHRAETIETAKDIRIFGLGNWLRQIYADALRAQAAFVHRRERSLVASAAFGVLMTLVQNAVAYLYLLKMTLDGNLSASEFLLYFTAISGFTTWISGILEDCGTIYRETQGIGAVIAYIDGSEPFRTKGGRPLPDTSKCELRLENVTFRYPGAEKNLFEHLNLTIHPGEKLAIVGLNGAGKTTIVKLLCGFYDPTEGSVTLNGIDIREFNRQDYYRLLCAVFQEFSVLDMTVAENIAQRTENIDEEKVWNCLELAGLADFVRGLPEGLNTHVGRDVYLDGVLFSGGQTQRLMLARALYKGGPLLVLDEPTAALDPIAESDIYEKYSQMSGGKTSIFISHRLASTRFCDRILFIADGKIAEEGTHEELLAKKGAYADLYEVQSRYYQEGADFRGEE